MTIGLSSDQRTAFERDGFLAIDAVLDDADLRPLEEEYEAVLAAAAAELYDAGKISKTYADLPFAERYIELLAEYPDLYAYLNISLPLLNERRDPATYRMHAGPAVFGLLRHPKLLDLAEAILGPEVLSNPVQQLRLKPPRRSVSNGVAENSNIGTTTWHQDIVALLPEADNTPLLTIWVAVTPATEEKGCLLSIPGSHRGGPTLHCPGKELAAEMYVPLDAEQLDRAVALPVGRGGVVLFDKHNVHCSLPNQSTALRWSLDLRYSPAGMPTGRPAFPGFLARSRANPERELRDPVQWKRLWDQARDDILSGAYQGPVFEEARWRANAESPLCA